MAVYTVLDREEIEAFIAPFGLGPLIDFEGIAEGIENTNYFITTDQSDFGSETQTQTLREFVLTIFENIELVELAFFTELTTYLNLKGLPVPCPVTDSNSRALQTLQGKPAIIVPKVTGKHIDQPNHEQCQAIGHALAAIHKACLASTLSHTSSHDLRWLITAIDTIKPKLSTLDQQLLDDELDHFQTTRARYPDLPRAIIHGDLFRDNALFVANKLSGIIDFNSAGEGYLLFDLAVVVNDWCSEHDGSLNNDHTNALLQHYQQARPLSTDECELWNDFLRIAALRFWVSRLQAQLSPELEYRPGSLIELKDPLHYKNILLQRIHNPCSFPIN